MASVIAVVPFGLLFKRDFQRWAASLRLYPSRHLNRKVSVSAQCLKALLIWRDREFLMEGMAMGVVSSQGGHHRSVLTGLGRDNGGTTCEWGMDRISQSNAYKLSGGTCSISGPQTLPSADKRLSCVSQIRQHNSGCLYKQARESPIEESACLGKRNIVMEQKSLAVSQSETCARPNEYQGGPVVEGESSPGGMEAPPRGSSGNMVQIWSGKSGSICLRGEHTLSPALLTKGDGCVTRDGCISTSLARDCYMLSHQ